ncbi:MAG: hypothetical protein P8Y70_00130 [Candidatus Lokiarchaeota archaeon]
MAGLDEKQWLEIKAGLNKINSLHDDVLILKIELKAIKEQFKEFKERPKIIKGWIPVIICVALFFLTAYDRIEDMILEKANNNSITVTTPAPTP